MTDGRWETQVAVYVALIAANVCEGRVFAPAAEGYSVFPYVEIGESDAIPADTNGATTVTKRGQNEVLTIHVWSRVPGQKETKQIISQIRDALHDRTLTVEGQSRAYSLIRSDRAFLDPDGKTQHGVVECRVLHHD